jgi:hypothetical protein
MSDELCNLHSMKIERQKPKNFSGYSESTKDSFEINSFEEFLNIEWIKCWSKLPDFRRFSYYPNNLLTIKEISILAEFGNGYEWFTVAKIKNCDFDLLTINLSIWEPIITTA